jgi:hypothetical protein
MMKRIKSHLDVYEVIGALGAMVFILILTKPVISLLIEKLN